MLRAAFCSIPVLVTVRLKPLQLQDGLGFPKVIILMNSVKMKVYIYISYPWIIVFCIYLFKYRVQHVLFDVLFLMIAVLFHFLKINKIKID